MEQVQDLNIPLEEIKLATNNFSDKNLIGGGGFGRVYIGNLTKFGKVAVKRLDRTLGQGDREFRMEIDTLSRCRHKNLITLVGFCEEDGENILVYEYAKHGSLDKYLVNEKLSWIQRLKICIDAARGVSYLHNDVGPEERVLHRDLKSSNILLNENWEAKISDFGLSKVGPSNVKDTYVVTNACGTIGYIDPQYAKSGILTKESDVYSFGVVLFEILCGTPALTNIYTGERRSLASLAQQSCEQNTLFEIIVPCLKNAIKEDSLGVFSLIAYECLKENPTERPTMARVTKELEKALTLQVNKEVARFIQLGTWGKESGRHEDNWSFELEQGHTLQKITVGHGDDVVYSLIFTSECEGVLHTSNKFGGSYCGETVSEVKLELDEEIVGINGNIGTQGGDTIISSLSFKTNKRVHGPFGRITNSAFSGPWDKSMFSVPWDKGSLVGFYGFASTHIDGIGVYVKPHDEIMRVGTWGTSHPGGPQNIWSFQLEKNHRLKKITIEYSKMICSMMFTTQNRGVTHTYEKAGGWNGGPRVWEVTFDWDEELIAISGTVDVSDRTYAGYTIISSISFVTNKKTHGPVGYYHSDEEGDPFTIAWNKGSFAGFYGLCGYYIDSIGVCLKATK
ncbi:putative serine/threonine-protein kinase PBL12 [Bidens hawaiensis]|uniref:putative serine/threonine-protein kinase PBL12 n=1 Tax=Bidens hawaiensis TaxID=980011 RepID=UPI00404B9848